jgi:hypothetical protein
LKRLTVLESSALTVKGMASLTSLTNLQALYLCGCGISIRERNSSVEDSCVALQASTGGDAAEAGLGDSSSDDGRAAGSNSMDSEKLEDSDVYGLVVKDGNASDPSREDPDCEGQRKADSLLVDVHLLAHRPCSSILEKDDCEVRCSNTRCWKQQPLQLVLVQAAVNTSQI